MTPPLRDRDLVLVFCSVLCWGLLPIDLLLVLAHALRHEPGAYAMAFGMAVVSIYFGRFSWRRARELGAPKDPS